jgi:head-tail adaptor
MNSGMMDIKITVQRGTFTDSSYGKATKPASWSTASTFWGRVTYNGGSESIGADKKEFRQTITVQGHYIDCSTILLTDRLYFNDTAWNITSRAQVGRNQYIRLEAVAVD